MRHSTTSFQLLKQPRIWGDPKKDQGSEQALISPDQSLLAAASKGDAGDVDFERPKLGAISRPADLD